MTEDISKPSRLLYIDNIRWLMIVLVILIHAAVTYSGLGSWYYIEPARLDAASFAVFGIFMSFTQAYFMGLLLFIAGYLVPGAFDRKGFSKFLGDRTVRLGIPTLIYVLFINTTIIYYILAFQWSTPRPSVEQYFRGYILSLDFLSGTGPMWFALALLIFSAMYSIIRLSLKYPHKSPNYGRFPGYMAIIGLGLLISVCTFAVRIIQPIGTSIMNMQLCFFPQYIALFIIGLIAYRKNWLARIPYSFGMVWFKITLICGSIFWLIIMILGGGLSGDLSKYEGGIYWQSAAYALWESFFCLGIGLGLIVIFREHFDKQGRFEKFMSQNSFAVYVFHAPILILVTLALREFTWHPLSKFAIASAISVTLCFLVCDLVLRRIPLLKRII